MPRPHSLNLLPVGSGLTTGANTLEVQETPDGVSGLILAARVTTHPGAETCAVMVQHYDPLSGVGTDFANFTALPNAAAPYSALKLVYGEALGPGAGTLAELGVLSGVEFKFHPIPRFWRVVLTPSASAGWVLSLGAQYV